MLHIIRITVCTHPYLLRLQLGKFHGIGFAVSTVLFQRPYDISAAEVVPLQCKLDMLHIRGRFAACSFQYARKHLHPALYGILRILDCSRAMRILRIVSALGSPHGIAASPSGFLHHDSLYELRIFIYPVFLCIFADKRAVLLHFFAYRDISCVAAVAEKIKRSSEQTAYDDHDYRYPASCDDR